VSYAYNKKKYLLPIREIPDDLWDEIKLILPLEKAKKTMGRPVVPFRNVLDGILYVLRTGWEWKMLPVITGSIPIFSRLLDLRPFNLFLQ
jgi:hypothetical protein